MFAPERSSGVSLFVRARWMRSSYARANSTNVSRSQCLMLGTSRMRVPSLRVVSTARPRLIPPRSTRIGLPSSTPYEHFIDGWRSVDFTMAHARICVNESFGRRCFASTMLAIRRFSSSAFTGTLRTLVAVGTRSEASMFSAILPPIDDSGTSVSPSPSAGRRVV